MLEGDNIILRGLEKEDVEVIHEYMNNPEVTQHLFGHYRPHSVEEEEEFIENALEEMKEGEEYIFGIESKDSSELIGTIGLTNINHKNRNAELGICIRQDSWEEGYGTEAEQLLIKYGFEELNLHKIGVRVFEFNERSIRVAEKAGFKKTGRSRETIYRNGKYWDVVYMDLLEEEFFEKID